MTKLKPIPRLLLFFLIVVVAPMSLALEAQASSRAEHQDRNERANTNQRSRPADSGLTSSACSAAMATGNFGSDTRAQSMSPSRGFGSGDTGASNRHPVERPINKRPKVSGHAPTLDQDDVGLQGDADEIDRKPRPPRRRERPLRPAAIPSRYSQHEDDDEDENDCDDYGDREYAYGNMSHAALRPMRQLGDIMGNMFDQMQGLASGG